MKKILIIFLICSIVFFIYFLTRDTKIYYISIGDYVSISNKKNYYGNKLENDVRYYNKDYRTVDLINDLENNQEIKNQGKKYRLTNLLIKADVITISIGMNDLLFFDEINDNMYVYIDDILINVEKVLGLVRYYSKEKIYIYNYFGFDKKFLKYINNRLSDIAKEYNVKIIDISSIKNRKKLTNKDYKYIENELIYNLKN